MRAQFSITKCAIEFRVRKEKEIEAIAYYEKLFDASKKQQFENLTLLEMKRGGGRWFYVGVRTIEPSQPLDGPVVYWFTEQPGKEVFSELLRGRPPIPADEFYAVTPEMELGRGSVIDEYGNRFGFTNPDYPPFIGADPKVDDNYK
jgi:hypothetical protein